MCRRVYNQKECPRCVSDALDKFSMVYHSHDLDPRKGRYLKRDDVEERVKAHTERVAREQEEIKR